MQRIASNVTRGGGIGLANRYSFPMVQQFVDDVILVSEEEIAAAIAALYRLEQIVCEGAAAVGLAALMAGRSSAATSRQSATHRSLAFRPRRARASAS